MIFVIGVVILKSMNRKSVYKSENEDVDSYVRNNIIKLMKEYDSYNVIKAMVIVIRTGYYKGIVKNNKTDRNVYLEYIDRICESNEEGVEPYSKEYINRVDMAIKDTKDEVLTYKGKLIYPFFHFTSSGETINAIDNINIPYLKRRKCSSDIESPDFMQIKKYSKDKLREIISKIVCVEKRIKGDINISSRDKYKKVKKVVIDNKYNIDGSVLQNELGLNSLNYSVHIDNDNIIFTSIGKGSGMGVSIYSAYRMSKNNVNYEQILNSFYKDVKIKRIYS